MPLSRIYSTRTSQPQQSVGINWGHPNSSGLVWAAEFGGSNRGRDATGIRPLSVAVGSITPVVGRYGLGGNFSSTVLAYSAAHPVAGTQITFELIFRLANKSIIQGLINRRSAFNSSNSFAIFGDFTGSGDILVQFGDAAGTNVGVNYSLPGASFAANVPYHLIVSVDVAAGTNAKVRAWLNGLTLSTSAISETALSAITSTTAPLELGRVNNGTLYANAAIWAARIYRGLFTDQRAASHAANPWQILAPIERSIWVPAIFPAGGAVALAADASAVVTASAALSVGKPLAAGASAEVTSSAALSAGKPLAATASASATGAAALSVGKPLAATASAAVNASADLGVGKPLAAGATAAVTASADLTVGNDLSRPLAATPSASVTASAELSVGKPLAASAAVSVTAVAGLNVGAIVVEAPAQVAGRPRRRRFQVEIDGNVYEVSSADEAQAVLERAKEEAQQVAKVAIERAAKAKRRPVKKVLADARKALVIPDIQAPPELSEYVGQLLDSIRTEYTSALNTIEIAAYLARRDREIEEDDEEILLLL